MRVTRTMCLAVSLAATLPAQQAAAGPFPVTGGSYYAANVAFRLAPDATVLGSASVAYTGVAATQYGTAGSVHDSCWERLGVQRLNSSGDSATFTLTLDQAYELNRIRTLYVSGTTLPADYQLRVYNGAGWTTVRAQGGGAPASADTAITFSKQSVTGIEWTVYGPVVGGQVQMMELMAYVAADAAAAPQRDGGYSITPAGASLSSQSNFESGATVMVNDLWNAGDRAGGTALAVATYDLGTIYRLNQIRMGFDQDGWIGLKIETSPDDATWTSFVDVTTTERYAKIYNFATPTDARYVRVTDKNGGWGRNYEMSVFAVPIPEPASPVLLALGGLALVRRRAR